MTPRRRRAAQRRRRWFFSLVTLGALFLLGAWFGLPPLLKDQGQTRLSALLHRPVTIGRVEVNPLNLALTVENFAVHEPDGRGVFLSWDRLYVSFELISFFRNKWKFTAIELDGPRARVVVNPDGSLNFSDLLALAQAPATAPAKATATPPKPLVVTRFLLRGARLDFSDHSRAQPFTTTLGPVGFSVKDFHTAGSEQSPYSFEAVTESGEKFAWHGWMEARPFRSSGELSVSGLILKKYAPYYAEKLGVDLTEGRLTVRGRYGVSFDRKDRMLKLLDGSLMLRNLRLVERTTGEPLLDLPAADITGATADGLELKAAVQSVVLQGGHLRLRREKSGALNLAGLLPPAEAPPATPVAARPAGPALDFHAGEMSLRDWQVDVLDLAAPRPVRLGLAGLNARLENFTLRDGARIPFEVALRWQPKGTVRALGTVVLKPVTVDCRLAVASLAVLPLSPYLEEVVNARLADGAVSVDGRATLMLEEGKTPAATFDGHAWLERFSLLDNLHVEELAGFSDLILNGLKVATVPRLALSLEDLNLNAPYAHVVLDEDRALNLAAVFAKAKSEAGAAPAAPPTPVVSLPGAAAPGPDIEVSRVVITGGDFTLTDRSITPQVRLTLASFGGTLSGLSSARPTGGEVDLQATVAGSGPLTIKGRLDPLGPNLLVDARVGLDGIDLLPFSPYAGKYAGYEIAGGKLFVDVTAKLLDRQVEVTDAVTLDQFNFGRATNSPVATKLPVRFGVALLKDLDGKIVLDVPVTGSLDDPNFKIGHVVWHVIGNILTKAAVSPFSLLGSMFGGGGEELSWQEFAPGESTLSPDGLAKMATLIKALTARPGLNLGLEGGFDAAADTAVLKRAKLAELVRRTLWEERHGRDPNIAPPDQIEVTAADEQAVIKRLFDRRFPPGTELGTPLPPPPYVPPPAPPASNLVKRVIDFMILKHPREVGAYRVAEQKAMKQYVQELKTVVATGLPAAEMTSRLEESMVVTPDDLRALATARAQRVHDYLVNEGKIAPGRLFFTQPAEPAAGEAAAAGKGTKVFLTLQ